MKTTKGRNNGTLNTLEPGDRLPGSGHPGGENFKTIANRYLSRVVKKENPLTGIDEKLTAMELLFLSLLNKALKGDVSATREILDRIEGKVTQSVNMNTTEKQRIFQIEVMDEETKKLIESGDFFQNG
jgi:hypothetical protein